MAFGGEKDTGGDEPGLCTGEALENEWQFAMARISAHHLRMVSLSSLTEYSARVGYMSWMC